MLMLFVLASAVASSNAFLLDVLGGNPIHTNPLLVTFCEPIKSTPEMKVMCEYRRSRMVCTAMCAAGYRFSFGDVMQMTSCGMDGKFDKGNTFPACITSISPVKPTIASGNIAGCVSGLSACPGNGLYPACSSCKEFVSCADDGAFLVQCPALTYFDNNSKRCEVSSSTCNV